MKHLAALGISLLFMLLPVTTSAQGENRPLGGGHAGMGYSGTTFGNIWGVSHNQAALASMDNWGFGAYYRNNFNVSELSVKAGSFALPLWNGVIAASFTHYGYSAYNESKFGLAWAMPLGEKLAAGIQLDYFNTHIANEFGNQGTATGEMGIQYEPFEDLRFGAHVFNPFRAKLSGYADEYLPTVFRAGASYLFADRFLLAIEGVQDISQNTELRVGARYYAVNHLYIRAGFSSNPNMAHFGLGISFGAIHANIAFTRHPALQYTTHVGMAYLP